MRTYPINTDCPLSNEEKKALDKLIDEAERSPLKKLTRGHTESTVDGYDKFEIDVTITWVLNHKMATYITIPRSQLLKTIPYEKSEN